MVDQHQNGKQEVPASSGGVSELKRTAARRRFLKGSAAAAGAGAVIVTFHHQRAGAAKKIMTSSAATCVSMHGTPGKATTVTDISKPSAGTITAYQCTKP